MTTKPQKIEGGWEDFITDGNRERPKWELDLEEYGDLHDEGCACMDEDNPDYCTCDMGGLKKIMYEAYSQAQASERQRCVEEARTKIRRELTPIDDKTEWRRGATDALKQVDRILSKIQAKHNLEKLT